MSKPFDGSYLAPGQAEELHGDIASALGVLLMRDCGGVFRLKRESLIRHGSFTVSRQRDDETGDLIFTVTKGDAQ